VTSTWLLNRRYAFAARRGDRRVEYAGYWAIQLVGAAVNFGCSACACAAAPAPQTWAFIAVAERPGGDAREFRARPQHGVPRSRERRLKRLRRRAY
jgi:hypothetical protein